MSPTRVKCPTCHRELDWETAPFRPFCSERCRLVDLGKWASGRYVVSSPVLDIDDGSLRNEQQGEDDN